MKTPTTFAALLAVTLACPSLALAQQTPQQSPSASGAQKQAGSQGQTSLSQSLTELDNVRQQIAAAGKDQFKGHIEKAKATLKKVQADIQGMQGAQAKSANESLVEAQEALVAPQPEKTQIVQALKTAVQDTRALQTQAQGSAQGSGQDSAGQQNTAQISVDQQAPQIGVKQPAPQITVKQPPAQVTVNQPPPQVNIEQPEPQVNVQQAEPKVTVQQPKPQVKIDQAGRAQVDVQRQGEAQVTQNSQETDTEQRRGDAGTAGTTAGSLAGMTSEQLIDKELYTADNSNVGEVEDIVMGTNARIKSVLVDVGGFLGLGERRVSIPIEQLRVEDNRLRTEMTRVQLNALPEYDENDMRD